MESLAGLGFAGFVSEIDGFRLLVITGLVPVNPMQ
jgi:hypothetical protein